MENDYVPQEPKPVRRPPWNKGKLIGAMRRTKAVVIYRRAGNLRAVQLLQRTWSAMASASPIMAQSRSEIVYEHRSPH
jgi:hypothetical protein